MTQILGKLSCPRICGAITGAGTDAFRVSKAYEATDWPALSPIAFKLGYPESEVFKGFPAALPAPVQLIFQKKAARKDSPQGGSLSS